MFRYKAFIEGEKIEVRKGNAQTVLELDIKLTTIIAALNNSDVESIEITIDRTLY